MCMGRRQTPSFYSRRKRKLFVKIMLVLNKGVVVLKTNVMLYAMMVFTIIMCMYTIFLIRKNQKVMNFLIVEGLDPKIQKSYIDHQKDVIRSQLNLNNMDVIRRANSDILPSTSYFGTNFAHSSKICQGKDAERCVDKFRNLETRIRTSKNHKLAACIIQKNMSTMLQAIMCFLHDEVLFRSSKRTFDRENYHIRLCNRKNEYNALFMMEKYLKISPLERRDWKYFAVIRNPLDRFLSGYVDKCIRKPRPPAFCNGCGANMTCFIISEYERMLRESKSAELSRSFEDVHFFPQNWRCNFKRYLNDYLFIDYTNKPDESRFMKDLFHLFRKQNVSGDSLRFIQDQMSQGKTVQTTISSSAREFFEHRLRSSPYLMEFVIRMFYFDYEILGYKLPKLG